MTSATQTPRKTQAEQNASKEPIITPNMTAEEYVEKAQSLHQSQYPGGGPPKLFQWIGDAALGVFPINRVSSAIGLTAGLTLGGFIAKTLTGHDFKGVAIPKEKTFTFMQKLHGIVKYDPKGLDSKNRWIGYGMWGIYSLGGLLGIKAGTTYAYRDVYKRNKNPEYLEDYVAKVSQHHSDVWAWLASISGTFASASGFSMLPIPGVNYGLSLAFRASEMKDENIMLGGGVGKWMSGSVTTSRFGVRRGLEELCRYAVNNPAKEPVQFEYLTYGILGQLFHEKVKPEHIQKFVAKLHEVRNKYMEDGGIPRNKRAAALNDLKAHFTKQGFEDRLEELGLDALQIDFLNLKGAVGKMSNLAAEGNVLKEQEEFRQKLIKRRLEKVVTPMIAELQHSPTTEAPTINIAPVAPKRVSDRVTTPAASHTEEVARMSQNQSSLQVG